MPISISGDGTITGVSVGGLPDGIVDTDMIATNAVNGAKIADIFSSGGITIGGLRIMTGSFTSPSSVSDAGGDLTYPGARYYFSTTLAVSGFATVPAFCSSLASGYHESYQSTVENSSSATAIKPLFAGHRSAGIANQPIYWAAIGQAS